MYNALRINPLDVRPYNHSLFYKE